MPELPEVETIKEQLKQKLIGKTIKDVVIYWDNIISFPNKEQFISNIKEQKIIDIKRRGKWLILELISYYLLIHLRMEGKFFLKTKKEDYLKHEHVIFTLDDDIELRYHDTRKFGKMHLILKNEFDQLTFFNKLGLEPFDEGLNINYLKNKYKHKTIAIKTSLLDQNIITGIGNIYADEILFLSGINPYKKTNKLKKKELKEIIDNTRKVLKEAIEFGGTTIRSYLSLDNQRGNFQQYLLVHGQKDKPCIKCHTSIIKEIINGRGTYYCPNCQK